MVCLGNSGKSPDTFPGQVLTDVKGGCFCLSEGYIEFVQD